jgi:phenylalanyl-tRNA synthetase alpha chain
LTDSYYLNKEYMLRTHTSAHEVETYKQGLDRWLISADVYRRDEIDASHYPVFHQMEGTQVWPSNELDTIKDLNAKLEQELASCPLIIEDETTISTSNPYQPTHDPRHAEEITKHLKHSLNSLILRLFGSQQLKGEPLRVRWIEAFFPFTSPSYEVEVWWNGEWLELLGCGVVQQKTLDQAGRSLFLFHHYLFFDWATTLTPGQSHKAGWAFGLGLERIAMVLFNIPDIRLFWSSDARFLSQFKSGQITQFQPYSKYPPCYKDMSFWLPAGATDLSSTTTTSTAGAAGGKGRVFHENDYCEIVREVAGDLVENVTLVRRATPHPPYEQYN